MSYVKHCFIICALNLLQFMSCYLIECSIITELMWVELKWWYSLKCQLVKWVKGKLLLPPLYGKWSELRNPKGRTSLSIPVYMSSYQLMYTRIDTHSQYYKKQLSTLNPILDQRLAPLVRYWASTEPMSVPSDVCLLSFPWGHLTRHTYTGQFTSVNCISFGD